MGNMFSDHITIWIADTLKSSVLNKLLDDCVIVFYMQKEMLFPRVMRVISLDHIWVC